MNTKDIIEHIKNNNPLKLEIVNVLIADDKCLAMLAREVLNTPLKRLGINSPGTLLDILKNEKQ